jgi:predicted nucleotidyltransferase
VKAYLEDLERQTHLPIERAMVFGSHAKGTPHRWSDIDLCIVSKRFRNRSQAIDYLWSRRPVEFAEIAPVGFPPRDFTLWDPLAAEIRRYGVRVR